MKRDDFLKEVSNWYRPELLRDFLEQVVSPDAVVKGYYEAFREPQSDGSFSARYYICTRNRLLVLDVSGADLRLSVHRLALLQKSGGKLPADPARGPNWAKGEWIFRFGTGQEMVKPDYPADETQLKGYLAILHHLLNY